MSDWNATYSRSSAPTRAGRRWVRGSAVAAAPYRGSPHRQGTVNPLMYLSDGDRWVVFASKGGHTAHPHWLRNVEANPEASIEVGTETIPVRATILREGPQRDELYARQVAAYPQFGEYEKKTAGHRTIPVIMLERIA